MVVLPNNNDLDKHFLTDDNSNYDDDYDNSDDDDDKDDDIDDDNNTDCDSDNGDIEEGKTGSERC